MNVITQNCTKVGNLLKRNSASILTGMGMVGVALTTYAGIKAAPKANKVLEEREEYKQEIYNESLTSFEKAIVLFPVYLPTILMGTATMSCIYGANHINKKQQAILMGAYSYLNSCYDDYREKVKELYGEETDEKIRAEIAKDIYAKIQNEMEQEEKENVKLYYDEISGRYFEFDHTKIKDTLYEINKMYNFTGELSLNNVYEYFNLEPTDIGATLGWSSVKDWECNGFSWIDIHQIPMEMPDNLECYTIKFNYGPSMDWGEWGW